MGLYRQYRQITNCIINMNGPTLPFLTELAAVAINDKIGFINKRGELVIPCEYEEADHFYKTLSIVKKGGLYGIISSIGQVMVPFEYQEILEFSEENAEVEKNNLFGYINLFRR